MSPRSLLRWLVAGLLLFVAGAPVQASTLTTVPLQVVGTLSVVSDLSVPHFEVGGYVLLLQGSDEKVAALVGEQVLVVGIEVRTPSIYQRPLLQVKEIRRLVDGRGTAPLLPPVDQFPLPVRPPLVLPPQTDPPRDDPRPTAPAVPKSPDQPVVVLSGAPDPLPGLPPDKSLPLSCQSFRIRCLSRLFRWCCLLPF